MNTISRIFQQFLSIIRGDGVDMTTCQSKAKIHRKCNGSKNLYWHSTKLDLLCISIQIYDKEYFESIDTEMMLNVIDNIIPDIKYCTPKDIRLSHADSKETAMANASRLVEEMALSEGSLIHGELGFGLDGIEVYFALSIITESHRDRPVIVIMQKPTQWSQNLKVK